MSQLSEDAKPIGLESLGRVTLRLGEALRDHRKDPANLYVLDAAIKRFELTYELSVRTLRRYLLDYSISDTEVRDMSFAGIVRRGDKEGLLLNGWPTWQRFRDARNETVHTYREEKARLIIDEAEAFLPEAEHLLKQLQSRLSS